MLIQLELSDDDQAMLLHMVEQYLAALHQELAHAERQEHKALLRRREKLLTALLMGLQQAHHIAL